MGTFEDRNRESAKRDEPTDKDKKGVPQREGEGSADKYPREGQGKTRREPGEESNPDNSGSSRNDRDDMDDRS